MTILTVTDEQLKLIQKALDLYSKIGTGQLSEIVYHPTFEKSLRKLVKDDEGWHKYHSRKDEINSLLNRVKNLLYNDEKDTPINSTWGIFNPKVDQSCLVAYDLLQVIRNEFWKNDPERSEVAVDSSVTLWTKDGDKIKCKIY